MAHVEKQKAECPASNPRLKEFINNAWSKLREYNNLTDNSHSIYAAATLLNPSQRRHFFKQYWTGEQEEWIPIMEERCWQHWRDKYYTEVKPQSITEPERQQHIMEAFLLGPHHTKKADEFHQYLNEPRVHISDIKAFNLIAWWDASRTEYPTLSQYVLDTLTIPATATECERTFSSAKKLVTPERNRLGDDVIEASECLKAWFDSDMIHQ